MRLSEWWQAGNDSNYEMIDMTHMVAHAFSSDSMIVIEDTVRDEVCIVGLTGEGERFDKYEGEFITSVEDLAKLNFIDMRQGAATHFIYSKLYKTFKPDFNFEHEDEVYERVRQNKEKIMKALNKVTRLSDDDEILEPEVLVMKRQDFTDSIVGVIVHQYENLKSSLGDINTILFDKEHDPNKPYIPKFYCYINNNNKQLLQGDSMSLEGYKTPLDFDFISHVLINGLGEHLAIEVLYELATIIVFYRKLSFAIPVMEEDVVKLEALLQSTKNRINENKEYMRKLGVDINE